jgi:Protein of unknown function (DUF3617)
MASRPLLPLGLVGWCVVCAWFGPEASAAPNQASQAAQAHIVPTGSMQPGNYHTTITYSNVRGLPPAMAQNMMSRPRTTDGCLETGDIDAVVQDEMAAGSGMTCSQDQGSASGGVISGVANCRDDSGTSGTLTVTGTYTSTHADVSADLNVPSSPMGPAFEHIHWVSDRTGSCP